MDPVDKKKTVKYFFDSAPACRNERVKQINYCFPKQIVSGRSLLQWGMKNLQFNSHINGG